MKITTKNWRSILIYGILSVIFILDIYMIKDIRRDRIMGVIGPEMYKFKTINSIQYQEIKEASGDGEPRLITISTIFYEYPDKLRIETEGNVKKIEIYNGSKYIYYDISNNKIRIKECFPPDKPYITEIEKRMKDIFKNGNYEFFGYEKLGNERTEVIGIRSKVDGNSYMHKLWMADIDETTLPVKEQYFVNNSVVSKTVYNYIGVNKPINPDVFTVNSLPKVEVVEEGVLPKYLESMEDVKKYLKFEPLLPDTVSEGLKVIEISVIPPVNKPSFKCILRRGDLSICLTEKQGSRTIKSNAALGSLPCEYFREDDKISLLWNQEGINITLSGHEDNEEYIIAIAESIAGGSFVLY